MDQIIEQFDTPDVLEFFTIFKYEYFHWQHPAIIKCFSPKTYVYKTLYHMDARINDLAILASAKVNQCLNCSIYTQDLGDLVSYAVITKIHYKTDNFTARACHNICGYIAADFGSKAKKRALDTQLQRVQEARKIFIDELNFNNCDINNCQVKEAYNDWQNEQNYLETLKEECNNG